MADSTEHKALQEVIMRGASYRLAQEDLEFLASDDLRPLRLQLELQKPEAALRKLNIHSTIVVFGSARTIPPLEARARLIRVKALAHAQPDDPSIQRELAKVKRQLAYSRYYDEARRFAQMVSSHFQEKERRDFVIVTGGGPGIMEAANRGAFEMGAHSIGLNITLPNEQAPNPFISSELAFRFHYFALRKMHFLLRARALVAFPGGYGTLDELLEVLNLVQTHKVVRIPIVLVGRAFWRRAVNFDFLVEEGMISEADAALITIVENAEEAIAILHDFYQSILP
jgi:uncharacterized protein (TIGR00730 family)